MIVASDGVSLDLENLEQVLNYTGNDVNYIQVVQNEITYRQTITRDGSGKITNVSRWVKQ
jgi:hypothetical protein